MRRRRTASVLCALAAGAALAAALAPTAAACDASKRQRAAKRVGSGPSPLAIGDSVMLGAVPQIARVGYEVDAKGCRQMGHGISLIAARKRAGRLPSLVVVALGANWMITSADIRAALRLLGSSRTLGLVTPREDGGGSGSDARVIRAAGRRYPDRVVVLDWVAHSAGHGSWFAGDGLHLTSSGASGLASLLRRALPYADPLESTWQRTGSGRFEALPARPLPTPGWAPLPAP